MFNFFYKSKGFTLIELIVSAGLFAVFSSMAFSIGLSMYESNQHILNKNLLYDETRILLEKIIRDSRVNTIDYYEYFSRNYKGEIDYGQRPGQYEMHFYTVSDYDASCTSSCFNNIEDSNNDYNPVFSWKNTDRGNDINLGQFDTGAKNTIGDQNFESARTLSDAFENELYLLSSDGTEKTIIRLVQEVDIVDTTGTVIVGTDLVFSYTVGSDTYSVIATVIHRDNNRIRLLSDNLNLLIGTTASNSDSSITVTTTSEFQTRVAMTKMMLVDCFVSCNGHTTSDDGDIVPDHWVPHDDFSRYKKLELATVSGLSEGVTLSSTTPFGSGDIESIDINNDTVILKNITGSFEVGNTITGGSSFSEDINGVENYGLVFVPISHPDIDIEKMNIFITPFDDPHKNFAAAEKTIGAVQISPHIQPNITMILAAKHMRDKDGAKPFSLQTSVSSRVYNNVTFPRP